MRTMILLGGGSIREKTTLSIDKYIAELAKDKAGDNRAYALFFPTASHDSKPYFNSFRKTYTSEFDIKSDVALLTRNEMSLEKVAEKIEKANLIYIGGGDTPYMIQLWRETGIDKLILDAYNRGVIIAGLSAGAICWFEKIYTDTEILNGIAEQYAIYDGLGLLKGVACPHYNERKEFDLVANDFDLSYAIENDCALRFDDEQLTGVISCGGNAYRFSKKEGIILREQLR